MGISESIARARAFGNAARAVNEKAAGGSLLAGTGAGYGVYGTTTPGLKRERLKHDVGWVAAVTMVLAQKIAAQPIRIARKARAADGPSKSKSARIKRHAVARVKHLTEDVELLDSHWLLDALHLPNEYLTGNAQMHLTVKSLDINGEAYWLIDRSGDRLRLYYLSADWVTPQHTDEGLFSSYKVIVQGTGHQQDVPPDDMVRFVRPDEKNPYAGAFSTLAANALAVVTDEYLQVSQQRTFQNGINPTMGVVIGRHPDVAGVPGQRPVLTREQRATLVAAIKQAYRGAMNHGEPIILDGMIEDVKQLSMSPAEMGYLESGKATKDRIVQGFLTNPIILGQVENANRASATIAHENYNEVRVNPLIEVVSATLTHNLALKVGEPDLLVWIEPCRAHDPDQRRMDLDQLAKYGCLKKNELRDAYDMPPMEGDDGDELAQAVPQQPIGQEAAGQPAKGFRFLNEG